MKIHVFPYGPLQANSYLISFANCAVLVDPCVSLDESDWGGLRIAGIFCTHGHFDHISEGERLRRITSAPIYAHRLDCPMIEGIDERPFIMKMPRAVISPPILQLEEKDIVSPKMLGVEEKADFQIEVLHTPGHSDGSVCFLVRDSDPATSEHAALFSGDTLFAGTVGRTDLGGSMTQMIASLGKIALLPDDLPVYPGHGPSTILGQEKRTNPYFTALSGNDII